VADSTFPLGSLVEKAVSWGDSFIISIDFH
jgi:hypothetical protein